VEEQLQRYEGLVRFLYLYVREAHSDPETAPCGPTEDLGWTHPSAHTTSVEERAQRARWLKNDFDLSFPYIIDFMDNRIKDEYWPYGNYVGWVIDCDGEVLVHEPWAWATPQTQWCGLPLASFDELEIFLNTYLAFPPQCYDGAKSRSFTYLVPAAAHTEGANDTTWVTDLVLVNPGLETAQASLFVHRRDTDNSQPEQLGYTIAPGQTLELLDVLATEASFEGAAALRIESDSQLIIASRTYNDTPEGAFGQLIRGFPAARAFGEEVVGHLLMLEESAGFRTNLGLASLSDGQIILTVEVFTSSGESLSSLHHTLPPYGYVQVDRFLRGYTSGKIEGARAEVRVVTPGGRAMAYASIVDNATGDPTYMDARLNTYAKEIAFPAAARLPGAEETFWVTDLTLHNARSQDVTAHLHLQPRKGEATQPAMAHVSVPAGQSLLVRDALGALFSATGAAALTVTGTDGLMAVSRTYNSSPAGTLGQFIPGMDVTGDSVLRPGDVGHLVQLEQMAGEGRRTNLGLVNLRSAPATVELSFFDGEGGLLGTVTQELAASAYVQLDKVLLEVGASEILNARAEVRLLTPGSRVLAYASSVDNRTGDPVFQGASKLQ